MECPFCNTENRGDRETCYHCGKDISMLRLISNKARHHYNLALEHAERHRYYEAIAELRNALDLDSNLVDAHVVLGTVYARLNQPEEARKQWEKALEVSKPHQKAHQYLQQLRQIRPYRGVLRRLRLILAGFAVAVGLCAGLATYLLWPNIPAQHLDQAWKAYQNDNLASAKAALDELSRPVSDPGLELSARSLTLAIEREFQDAMAAVERLRRQDHPYQAMEKAQTFLERRPPQYADEAIQQAIREVRSDLVDSLRSRIGDVGDSPARLDQTENALEQFLGHFPEAPERDSLLREFQQARRHYATLRLDQIRQNYGGARDYATALISLRALKDEVGSDRLPAPPEGRLAALGAEIEAEIDRVRSSEFAALLDQARKAMNAGELRPAAAALENAESLRVEDPMKEAEVVALRGELAVKQRDWLLRTIKRDVAERNWDGALAAADRISSGSLDSMTREAVARMTDTARRARAVESYHWLMVRADRIEPARLDREQAGEIVRRARIVLDDLPMDLYPAALDDALYFLAAAEQSLGREGEARSALERLRRECPGSRYIAQFNPKTGLPVSWARPEES